MHLIFKNITEECYMTIALLLQEEGHLQQNNVKLLQDFDFFLNSDKPILDGNTLKFGLLLLQFDDYHFKCCLVVKDWF